jgi:hypothetical protein
MLWKHEVEGLQHLPFSRKIALTTFLIVIGVGYVFGFFNILLSYGANDGIPGISLKDISIAFYGARDKTALQKSIDGSMRVYFSSDADYNSITEWLDDGGKEKEFATIKPILDESCNTCHSAEVMVADVALDTYEHTEEWLSQDTGKSIPRLVGISHTHILASATVVFLLVSILCSTTYPQPLKVTLCAWSYFTIALDIAGWWLAKVSPSLSFMVILGGASMGTAWGLLIVLPLYELWFKRPKDAEEAAQT